MNHQSMLGLLFQDRAEAFLNEQWPQTLSHHRASPRRLTMFNGNPDLNNVASLLNWCDSAGYRGIQADFAVSRDEIEHLEGLSANQARLALRSGMTVRMQLDEEFGELRHFVSAIKTELELPSYAMARSLVFCSPVGGGTSVHFDANANIVVQIQGEKRWLVAPNDLENPTDRYSTGMDRVPLRLSDYVRELPRELPARCRELARTVHMVPGDVLFVPRGWWHATETAAESMQINFVCDSPTWAGLVTSALRRTLERSPAWRGVATGLRSESAPRRARAEQALRPLLAALGPTVAGREAAELLADAEWWEKAVLSEAQRPPSPRFQRSSPCQVSLVGDLLSVRDKQDSFETRFEPEFLEALRFVCDTTAPFGRETIEERCPQLDRGNVSRLLSFLCERGVLVEASW